MKRCLLPLLFCLISLQAFAQQTVLNKQRNFPKTVPAGNYSGITWLGDDRYAVVNDKSQTAGFHLMTIHIDDTTGDIKEVRVDTFLTSNQPNRDEEGICFVPQTNTVFVSGEADGKIIEYRLNGQPTGRQLNIPGVFRFSLSNGGFEALTYNAATHRYWTTTENTLKLDGKEPSIKRKIPNLLRFQSFDDNLQPREQYWYMSDSSVVQGEEGKSTLGVSGLAALDDGQIIVLEREIRQTPKYIGSFVHVKLYVVNPSTQRANDLLQKQLIAEFRTKINITDRSFANYEGLCVGPRLKDGRIMLLLVADSQDQYKGYLKDWFKTIVITNPNFKPQPNTTDDMMVLVNHFDSREPRPRINAFLTREEQPDPTRYIASPPQPGNGTFENDTYYYNWGKAQRQTPRGTLAAIDEVIETTKAFSPAAGFLISHEETPEIYKLVEGARRDARVINRQAKDYFRRTRPFIHFKEPSLIPIFDAEYSTTYSYPSGHSVRGYIYAMTLALVVPDSSEALIARAEEYALNRVICGRHWKSDIDASLVEATVIMSRLLSNTAFTAQLKEARKEYARLQKKK